MLDRLSANAMGTPQRKPPLAPSVRNRASRAVSDRAGRRASKRPPPYPGSGRLTTGIRPALSSSSVVSSAQSPRGSAGTSGSTERGPVLSTRELHDELVRTLMTEVRQQMRPIVDVAIERAVAPLLEKQRELEGALKELRARQGRAQSSADPSPARSGDAPTSPRSSELGTRVAAASTAATQTDAVAVSVLDTGDAGATRSRDLVAVPAAVTAPYAAATLDIPLELDGSRRKKTIAWLLGVVALLLILAMAGLSALSNVGIRL
jgi:hypothetical protein